MCLCGTRRLVHSTDIHFSLLLSASLCLHPLGVPLLVFSVETFRRLANVRASRGAFPVRRPAIALPPRRLPSFAGADPSYAAAAPQCRPLGRPDHLKGCSLARQGAEAASAATKTTTTTTTSLRPRRRRRHSDCSHFHRPLLMPFYTTQNVCSGPESGPASASAPFCYIFRCPDQLCLRYNTRTNLALHKATAAANHTRRKR